jgi:hypothetical protein
MGTRPQLVARRLARSARATVAIPVAGLGLAVAGAVAPAASGGPSVGGWSAPSRLAACTAPGQHPLVTFPSDAPTSPTGSGAVVWVQARSGCGGDGLSLAVGRLGADDRVADVRMQALPANPTLTAASGTSLGRIAVALPSATATPAVRQGHAGHRLVAVRTIEAPPGQLAMARAYLGDLAVAVHEPDNTIAVYVERHYRQRFDPPVSIPVGSGAVTALTATMDFRADVLVAWQQGGAIWAHMLRQSGRPDPTQRVGSSGASPQLSALVSDNDHGMVAWSTTAAGTGSEPTTSVRLALSAAGVRFDGSRELASYADPERIGAAEGSLALVRLSSENVLLAWTAPLAGRLSVLTAPAVYAGVRPSVRLEAPGDAVLGGLAAGPAREAVAVYRSLPPGTATRLFSARLSIGHHDRVEADPPQPLGAGGQPGIPTVAVDPATDRPVAAWTQGAAGALEYATGSGLAGYAAHPVPEPALGGSSVHWLRIAGAAAIGLAALVIAGWLFARRRRARGQAAR